MQNSFIGVTCVLAFHVEDNEFPTCDIVKTLASKAWAFIIHTQPTSSSRNGSVNSPFSKPETLASTGQKAAAKEPPSPPRGSTVKPSF